MFFTFLTFVCIRLKLKFDEVSRWRGKYISTQHFSKFSTKGKKCQLKELKDRDQLCFVSSKKLIKRPENRWHAIGTMSSSPSASISFSFVSALLLFFVGPRCHQLWKEPLSICSSFFEERHFFPFYLPKWDQKEQQQQSKTKKTSDAFSFLTFPGSKNVLSRVVQRIHPIDDLDIIPDVYVSTLRDLLHFNRNRKIRSFLLYAFL